MAKTVGGVRGNETLTASRLTYGVYRNAEVQKYVEQAMETRQTVARTTLSEMWRTRRAKGSAATIRQYTKEIGLLSKEIEERFGTTDAGTILTRRGIYNGGDAETTAMLLRMNTAPRPGAGKEYHNARDWWPRIARLDALKKGLAGISANRIQFSSYNTERFIGQGI